jgi:hypothetical protein
MKQAAGFVRQSLKEVSWLMLGLMISLGLILGLMLGYARSISRGSGALRAAPMSSFMNRWE